MRITYWMAKVLLLGSLVLATTAWGQEEPIISPLIVDIRTDYLPGIEFSATRTTLDGASAQDMPAFTTDDFVAGERAAIFELPAGIYVAEVFLLRTDETVLDSSSIVITKGDSAFGAIVLIARTGEPPAASCEEARATCITEKATIADLLETCSTQNLLCESSLGNCNGLLETCNVELEGITADGDRDGVGAVLDMCPETPLGSAVDVTGCSVDQFCSSFSIPIPQDHRICLMADWRNDEMGVPNPRDCRVSTEDTCVPQD